MMRLAKSPRYFRVCRDEVNLKKTVKLRIYSLTGSLRRSHK